MQRYLRYLRRLGWIGVLAAVLVVAGIVLAAFKEFLGGGVLIVVALVVAQLAPRALGWYTKQREQDQEEASLLRIRRPIGEVDPFEERLVFPSALAQRDHAGHEPPYVHREVDTALREALNTKEFVLVTGASKAGKSRTAFEAARAMRPEPTLLVPASPAALPKVLGLDDLPVNRSRPSVLWLDDLDRYVEDPGMSRTLFDGLGKYESHVVVLATITWSAYERLRSGEGEIGRSAREVLDVFETEISLPSELSPAEREEAQRLYPSQHFVAGIGEHFAAAHELLTRFKAALETYRHGFAVVVAALDWRRAGLSRPITEADLRELYALCLERFYPLLKADDMDYQDGVTWACEPLESRAALLMPTTDEGVEGFRIFDYVRDWSDSAGSDVDRRLRDVPEPTWRFVISRAVPAEAETVGVAAYTRGDLDAAENAWTKVVDSGDPELAPIAAYNLGVLFAEQGDFTRAKEAYQQAIDSEDPDKASKAAVNLGLLFSRQGDFIRAKEAYQQAIDSGHADMAPKAASALKSLRPSSPEQNS